MRIQKSSKCALLALLGLVAGAAAPAAESPFVKRPELEPDIRFWTRVYTEVTTNAGFVHDDRNLDVVYEVITFPETLSPAQRSKVVDAARDKYSAILKRLASGSGTDAADEQRVRALWPANTSTRALHEAAEHVRFQLGQADRFKAGLIRSGAYEAHIAETLANMGLPAEIAALPHVESSFDPTAYSKAGAAGLWQFMRSTGRRFMRIDSTVDERMDPYRSTIAAAQLLQFNYDLLGTWPLAITAYNHGASGMRRAKERQGTDDIVVIIRNHQSRTFGFASRNYYVAFLAALDVDRESEKYFGPLTRNTEVKSRALGVPDYVPVSTMQRVLGIDVATLRALNPSLTSAVWNGERYIPRGFELHVPEATAPQDLKVRLASLGPTERFEQQKMDKIYRVRSGDTLSAIASSHGTTVATLMRLNDLHSAHQVRRGQILQLPGTEPKPVTVAAVTPAPAAAAPAGQAPAGQAPAGQAPPVPAEVYVVKRGDSLSNIARQAGLTEQELMAQNGLKDRNFIYEGQKLQIASIAGEKLPTGIVTITDVTPQPAIADVEAQPEEIPQSEREIALAQAAQPVSAAQAEEISPNLVSGAESTTMTADPSDYTVADDGTIEVQAAETLGHYADWLGVRASRLRELNGMRFATPVVIGQRLKIDTTTVAADQFVQRRRSYHQRLQEDFFAANRIVGTEVHVVRRGESLWSIAQKYPNVPIWLLRQYNPDISFDDVRPRTQLVMPLIEASGTQSAAGSSG